MNVQRCVKLQCRTQTDQVLFIPYKESLASNHSLVQHTGYKTMTHFHHLKNKSGKASKSSEKF